MMKVRKKAGHFAVLCSVALVMFMGGCENGKDTILIGEEEQVSLPPEGESHAGTEQETGEEAEAERVCVYVCGAVMEPGVVKLPKDSRAEDALRAAGGFAADAAREAVNLAARVTDGEMLYFPTRQEADELQVEREAAEAGLININTADEAALCTLPGIGETRARDIIAYREVSGAFADCEDIMKVPGIKASVYEKIRDKITVR